MTTRHVIKQLNLLIDGRLERDEALKAMGHLAECESCSAEWEDLRRSREALQTSGSGIDMRFAQRLLDRERIAVIAKAEPHRHAKAASSTHSHVLKGSLAITSGALGILTFLYLLGEPREIDLSTFLAANSTDAHSNGTISMFEGERTTGSTETVSPEWASQDMVPLQTVTHDIEGMRVSRTTVRIGEDEGVVTESRGRLSDSAGDELERTNLVNREVYLLDGDAPSVIFQSGDKVVMIDCVCTEEVLVGLAEAFPEEQQPGVFARIGDGAGQVASVVSGD